MTNICQCKTSSYKISPVDLGPQVDQVNPHSLDFHPRGFQMFGLLWISLEEPGGGAATTTATDWSSFEVDWFRDCSLLLSKYFVFMTKQSKV